MRRVFTIVFAITLFSCLDENRVDPAKPATFVRYINGGNEDWAQALQKTGDGGYIILANTINRAEVDDTTKVAYKIKLIKTTSYGTVEWTQVLPKTPDPRTTGYKGYSIYVTPDGYIISGEMIDTKGKSKLLVLQADLGGDTNKEKHFAVDLTSVGNEVNVYGMASYWSAADKLLILGSVSGGSDNMVLAELEVNTSTWAINRIPWQWAYGAGPSTVLPIMFIDSGNDVVFGGTVTQLGNASETDMRVIKAEQNSQGTKFSIDYGDSNVSEYVNGICETPSGYGLIGSTTQSGGTDRDILLTKISEVGGVMFSKVLPVFYAESETVAEGIQEGNAIASTKDNGFIIVGTIESTTSGELSIGRGDTDYYLIKTNGFGDVEWRQAFGSKRGDQGVGVVQADDGGYVILGTTQLANVPTIALIKTNSLGEIE